MTRWYPRNYVIVRDGKFERAIVKDATHEAAIILAHNEATGLNKPEAFDDSSLVIPDTPTEGE